VIFEGEDPWTNARSADSDASAIGINAEKPFGSESPMAVTAENFRNFCGS